jgi:hypothetical protein
VAPAAREVLLVSARLPAEKERVKEIARFRLRHAGDRPEATGHHRHLDDMNQNRVIAEHFGVPFAFLAIGIAAYGSLWLMELMFWFAQFIGI